MIPDWRQAPEGLLRKVALGEMATAVGDEVLTAQSVGSSVLLVIADRGAPLAGLAHVVLPHAGARRDGHLAGRYADSAVAELRRRLLAQGGAQPRLGAVVVGGARLAGTAGDVGRDNLRALETALRQARIPVLQQEVGGTIGRTVHFSPGTRRLCVQVHPARTGVSF